MITLLLGPQGHGKSTYILNKINEDYEHRVRSFLIVPEQQTLSWERTLAEKLPPNAQLYTEATNMTRLANTVFRQTGGLKYNYVTKGGQNLIMYRAICEVRDTLSQYKIPKGREKTCIKLFLQAIGELKSYGVNASQLKRAMEEIESESLRLRLQDIITVWTCYDAILCDMYDDPYDDLRMLEEKLRDFKLFENANVYIDSFYGFTKQQLNIVKRIISDGKNVTVALDCPSDANEHTLQYTKIARTRDTLISICKELKKDLATVSFDTDYKHGATSEEIAYLCKNLWSFDAPSIEHKDDVKLAIASDEFSECEYVCTQIKELVLSGEKYGDIAIIARNSSTYQGIIDFCLDKYDIPYYFSASSKLLSKPLIKMVLSALNFITGMKGEDIVTYAKCRYTDVSAEDLHLLECYIYKWNIYGKKFKDDDYWNANPNGYVPNMSEAEARDLAKIQDARSELLSHLSILEKPFLNGATVKECALSVYRFLESHSVQEKLLKEIKSEKSASEAQELSQVWGALIDALNLVSSICKDSVCDPATFTTLLTYAMMDTKIGSIPTGEDNVLIADASLIRAKNLRHVFVLGANVGVFPATVNDNSFFSDRDKIELETVQIDLSARTDERGDDELLFFKNSISAASHSVTVTALSFDINGKKQEESVGFSRIKSLLKGIPVFDASRQSVLDKVFSKKNAKELYSTATAKEKSAILKAIGEDTAPCASFVNERDAIAPDLAKEIFGKRLYLSKSRLETFAKCRFNYYCSYVLNLKDAEKFTFTHNDIGTLVHAIFEHFLKLHKEDKREYSDNAIFEAVTRLTDEYTSQICGVRALSNRMKHFFARLKATVCVFVRALLEEMKASKFTPEYFELSINGDGYSAPLPLEFPIDDDFSVIITGIADRVDVYRENDVAYIKIFDYKTGAYEFNLSKLQKGLDLQMLIYLLALCSMKESKFKDDVLKWAKRVEPAGVVYLSYKINKTDAKKEVDLYSDEADSNEQSAIISKITRSGVELDDDTVKAESDTFALKKGSGVSSDDFKDIFELVKCSVAKIGIDILTGDAQAEPLEGESPCDYCKNGAVCRNRRKSQRGK